MRDLLKLMEDGRSRSVKELAVLFKTNEEDIRRRMEYLEHGGYLRKISGCGQKCGGCSFNCSQAQNSLNGLPVFWELVEKE